MAITKVSRGLLSTGIVDNSNATAITIDSSENVTLAGTLSSGAITSSGNISLGGSDGDNAVLTLAANTGNWVFTNVQANRNLEISETELVEILTLGSAALAFSDSKSSVTLQLSTFPKELIVLFNIVTLTVLGDNSIALLKA